MQWWAWWACVVKWSWDLCWQ